MPLDNFYLNTTLILLICYLIGSFPSAYIAGKIKGIDIKTSGSRNVGGMNTISSVGKLAGVLVIIVDIGKGALAAYLGSKLSKHPLIPLLAVVAAMIGHNWMVYIGFKGGKGLSAFLGGLLFLSPWSFLFLYIIFVPICIILTKDAYIGTSIGLFVFSLFLWAWEGSYQWVIFGILVFLIYSIKSYSLIKTYFTENRREVYPMFKKIFKPFFKS